MFSREYDTASGQTWFIAEITTVRLSQIATRTDNKALRINVGAVLPLADARSAHENDGREGAVLFFIGEYRIADNTRSHFYAAGFTSR